MCAYPSVVARATVADSEYHLYCTVSERPSVSNDRPSSTDVSQMLLIGTRPRQVGFQRAMSPAGAPLWKTDAIEIRSQCDRASVVVIDVALQVGHSGVGHRPGRSCDDREICGRSRSRMMLELMRERAATARPMRIAPDREARQRSCAEQHGWTAPSSAPSIQAESPRSTVGGPLLGDLTNKGETVLNGRPFLCRSPKTVLTKNLFLGRPRWPRRSGTRTARWGRWSDSWVTVTRGDHSPHIPPHL